MEERHGYGEEHYYNTGGLKFKGQYNNGNKWNGEGYDTLNNIVYELKDGKGLIKEYYKNGNLIFEGEYLKGEKNGKGKEYECFGGILLFEGEYLNGKRNGKGKGYYDNGIIKFDGIYLTTLCRKENFI